MKLNLSRDTVIRIFSAVLAASGDKTRSTLNSLLVRVEATTNGFRVVGVGTTGHWLALAWEAISATECDVLIPRDTALAILRVARKAKGPLGALELDTDECTATTFGQSWKWSKVDGTFPPYNQVIPSLDAEREGIRRIGIDGRLLDACTEFFASVGEFPGSRSVNLVMDFAGTDTDPITVTCGLVGAQDAMAIVMPMRI